MGHSSNPLFGDAVRSALSELEGVQPIPEPLQVVERLKRVLAADVAREAAALFALRLRARAKYPGHVPSYMTRRGLEQASAGPVADERARRVLATLPGALTLDATCGIGADVLALARHGRASATRVVAADHDPHLAACVRANLDAAELPGHALVADALRPALRPEVVLLDPDRRVGERRSLDPERWSPTLSASIEVTERCTGACIKLAPAFDPTLLKEPARLPHGSTLRWVSLAGELAEVALWTGALADAEDSASARPGRVAVCLDRRGGRAELRGEAEEVTALAPADLDRVAWLAEPDPAIIRAGLIGTVCRTEGLRPIAPESAYLGGDTPPRSPFVRAWRVLGSSSTDPKRVRALLGEHDVGPLTVKKRGHPDDAATLARRLRGPGTRRGLLAIGRLERGHRAFLLQEQAEGTS